MREFRFRAWDKDEKRMYDWTNIMTGFMQGFFSDTYNVELMQFTGLHDKNGTPIYEGDILSNKTGRICKVVWFEAQACFDAKPLTSKGTSALFTPNYWRHCEVIGNIYENKELIP
jgi:uncharacterized phage protein (TIGR01671 family)